MTSHVIEEMFQIADINKTTTLDSNEYSSFVDKFVRPFLLCAKDWAITNDEQIDCVLRDKWADNIF